MLGTKFYKPLQNDTITVYEEREVVNGKGEKVKIQVPVEKPNDAPNTLSKYAEAAKWCNEQGTATIEDKGDYYEVVAIVIPEPTPEEIQDKLTVSVQRYLDTTAQKLNYDSCLSVCSYVNTGVAKFDEEGAAFRQWRSAVWQKGYEIVDAVKAGTRDIPTEEELFAELPTIQLEREELKS